MFAFNTASDLPPWITRRNSGKSLKNEAQQSWAKENALIS
jgi:hypothetical protein